MIKEIAKSSALYPLYFLTHPVMASKFWENIDYVAVMAPRGILKDFMLAQVYSRVGMHRSALKKISTVLITVYDDKNRDELTWLLYKIYILALRYAFDARSELDFLGIAATSFKTLDKDLLDYVPELSESNKAMLRSTILKRENNGLKIIKGGKQNSR